MFCDATFKDTCNGLTSQGHPSPPHQTEESKGARKREAWMRQMAFLKKQIKELAAVCVDKLGEERWRSSMISFVECHLFLSHVLAF